MKFYLLIITINLVEIIFNIIKACNFRSNFEYIINFINPKNNEINLHNDIFKNNKYLELIILNYEVITSKLSKNYLFNHINNNNSSDKKIKISFAYLLYSSGILVCENSSELTHKFRKSDLFAPNYLLLLFQAI